MNRDEPESWVYFRIHMLLVLVGVAWYSIAIAWLIWRIVVGGAFEITLGLVVIGVLLCVMLTACGSAAAIAWDGRPRRSQIKPPAAQSKLVSADRWTIREPAERRRFS
jgi:hypothetical protein